MRIDVLNIEMAFDILKCGILIFLKQRPWNKVFIKSVIYNDATQTGYFRVYNNETYEENEYIPSFEDDCGEMDALFFLRNQILQETGKRIWGLTFTLYPDGKQTIAYDYNVPEGFNEQGEWIGEDHGNKELSDFFDNIRNIGTDEFELK